MAKKKEAPVEGEEAPKKKKPIKLILAVVVVGVGVKMFVLKDPPPTAAQQKAAALHAQQELYNKCAEANHLPTLGDMVIGAEPGSATTSKGAKSTATSAAAETPVTAPGVEGPILPADQSVKLILRDGNFLQVGLAIQLPVGALAKIAKDDGLLSKATDLALTTLAKHEMKDLVSPEARDKIKQQLSFDTCRETNAAIMSILFTEFVMSSK